MNGKRWPETAELARVYRRLEIAAAALEIAKDALSKSLDSLDAKLAVDGIDTDENFAFLDSIAQKAEEER